MLPFLGTTLGALCVVFSKRDSSPRMMKIIEGFSAGVMIAASIWSLLIPSIELAPGEGALTVLPAVVGFLAGFLFFILAEALLDRYKKRHPEADGRTEIKGNLFPIVAVAVHNLPEGMAVGAIYAEVLRAADVKSAMSAAVALSIGIAVQNFPEGMIVSLPLRAMGMSRRKSFLIGVISGVIEPVGALITILAAGLAVPLLPYLLSFAAGAMVYAVFAGFTESDSEGVSTSWMLSLAVGFCLMMSLDVILG